MKNNGASVSRMFIIKFDGRLAKRVQNGGKYLVFLSLYMALISVFEDVLCSDIV